MTTFQKSDGANYAPRGTANIVVRPGEFRFAAIGLDHGHIFGMCNGLLEAGADVLDSRLQREGVTTDVMHSNRQMKHRTRALERFSTGKVRVNKTGASRIEDKTQGVRATRSSVARIINISNAADFHPRHTIT